MASSKSEHSTPAADPAPEVVTAAEYTGTPALEQATTREPGAGEVVVQSPTGTRSVVSEDAVDVLKTQGYKVV